MKLFAKIVLISGLASLTACATFPRDRFCKLSPSQVATLRANLAPILSSISDESVRYWPRIFEDRYIYKRPSYCLCMLYPESVDPNMLVLDGAYAIQVDPETMAVSQLREAID